MLIHYPKAQIYTNAFRLLIKDVEEIMKSYSYSYDSGVDGKNAVF